MSSIQEDVLRKDVVQACLDLFANPEYLEIGVWKGKTFFPVKASRKVAVDPNFAFDVDAASQKYKNCHFFSKTSDDYFYSMHEDEKFDVIYLDGLHTLEQTLRDLINSLSFIKSDGIIIIDDVYPPSYQASLPNLSHSHVVKKALKSEDKSWMGDVYKLVLFVETFFQQYDYSVTSNNHGQLIMWPHSREAVEQRSLEAIARAPFESIFTEEKHFNRKPLHAIIDIIKLSRIKKNK